MPKIKILFIALEFKYWAQARHWSYCVQLGFEEGFRENGVECFTVPSMWLPRIKEICSGKKFDQVWVEIVNNKIDESLFEWLVEIAPIRVGLIGESLEYAREDYEIYPVLKERRSFVEKRFKYLTHIVAIDENDADRINKNNVPLKAMWLPSAVPKRFILEKTPCTSPKKYGAFIGDIYYPRSIWLNSPELKGLLVKQTSLDDYTPYPYLFNALHFFTQLFIKCRLPAAKHTLLIIYLPCLRYIRIHLFKLWLKSLQKNIAVVNLPSLVKAYPGRVVEGMAAGRIVISWNIPNRPHNERLFTDGKEILLYSNDDRQQLAEHIRSVITDPDLADTIVSNARNKILQFHTMEKRVNQILEWIEKGESAEYT
jgi:hypothetical protein